MNNTPIQFSFLICTERSGSNLITKIFNNHHDVCGPSPCYIIEMLSTHLSRYGNLDHDLHWQTFLTDAVDIFNAKNAVWQASFTVDELQTQLKQRTLSTLVRYMYTKEARLSGKRHLFIKERETYQYISFLLLAFPDAKYIYQVRDPRDVALSWRNSLVRGQGIVEGAKIWQHEQQHNICLYSFLKEQDKIMHLRYEDLLKNPTVELQRLCQFMALSFDSNMLNFHQSKHTIANAEANINWINLKRPLIKTNYCNYKSAMSLPERHYVEKLCHKEMAFLNYQQDDKTSSTLSDLEIKVIQLDENYRKKHCKSYFEHEKTVRAVRNKVLTRIEQRLTKGELIKLGH